MSERMDYFVRAVPKGGNGKRTVAVNVLDLSDVSFRRFVCDCLGRKLGLIVGIKSGEETKPYTTPYTEKELELRYV